MGEELALAESIGISIQISGVTATGKVSAILMALGVSVAVVPTAATDSRTVELTSLYEP